MHRKIHDIIRALKHYSSAPDIYEDAEEEVEGVSIDRTPKIIIIVSVAWAIFQLLLPHLLLLDTLIVRATHLTFALVLAFLTAGLWKKSKPAFLRRNGWKIVYAALTALFFALLIFVSCYIIIDWQGIAARSGLPLFRDMLIGAALIVLLLEATRRKIGKALVLTVLFFIVYALFAPYFPGILAFKGVSLPDFFSQITLSFEGIYGVPLGISASTIYLFVLMGALFERAGAGKYFTNLALALVGRTRGGPAKSAVVSSAMVGTISGSSIANVVTSGTFTIPLMKKSGFPPVKAAAIEVAASTDGQLMPPIMGAAAFIIAEYVNIPYVEVIKAALIPAIISLASLFFVVHFEASKLGLRRLAKEQHIPRFTTTLLSGIHYLAVIAFLLYEMMVKRHSPELSVYKAVLLLLLIILIRELWKGYKRGRILTGLKAAGKTVVEGCILGSRNMVPGRTRHRHPPGIIIGVISMGPGSIITWVVGLLSGGNIFLLLLFTRHRLHYSGMGLPTTATLHP